MSAKIDGWYPIVRCVCGRQHIVKRATACKCGVTLRVKRGPGNVVTPRGIAMDHYDLKAQPYQEIVIIGWEDGNG